MVAAQLRKEFDLIFNLCITKLGAVYALRSKFEIWQSNLKTVTIASISAYSKNEACLGFKTLSLPLRHSPWSLQVCRETVMRALDRSYIKRCVRIAFRHDRWNAKPKFHLMDRESLKGYIYIHLFWSYIILQQFTLTCKIKFYTWIWNNNK